MFLKKIVIVIVVLFVVLSALKSYQAVGSASAQVQRSALGSQHILYASFFGGRVNDSIEVIGRDGAGNIYLAGRTQSDDLPVTEGAYDTVGGYDPVAGWNNDLFVAKFDSTGRTLIYATYLGGTDDEFLEDMVVDNEGYVYLTGHTNSTDYPVTEGAYQTKPVRIFITKLNREGSALEFSTYFGGETFDTVEALAVDDQGQVYVTGRAPTDEFPTTEGAYDTSFNGNGDAFISQFSADGQSLLYSTFLGGSRNDEGHDIAVDSSGQVYVAGTTLSDDYPTSENAFDQTFVDDGLNREDVFVAKLSSDGSSLIYSTYLGASGEEERPVLTIDSEEHAYIAGETRSLQGTVEDGHLFPVTEGAFDTKPITPTFTAVTWGFVSKLNPTGSDLIFSTFLGGTDDESMNDIALDESNNVYVIGDTKSSDYPTTSGAYDTEFSGGRNGLITVLNNTGTSLLYSTYFQDYEYDNRFHVDSAGQTILIAGTTYDENFPVTADGYDTSYSDRGDGFFLNLWISDSPAPTPVPTFTPAPTATPGGTSELDQHIYLPAIIK